VGYYPAKDHVIPIPSSIASGGYLDDYRGWLGHLSGGEPVRIIEALSAYDEVTGRLEDRLPSLLFLLPKMTPSEDLRWDGEVAKDRMRLNIKNMWIDRTCGEAEIVINLIQILGINEEERLDLRFNSEYFERWLYAR